MKRIFLAAAAVIAAGTLEAAVDCRTRTFVGPTRIVWSTNACGAAVLTSPRLGQVPEGRFLEGTGCRLEAGTNGAPSAVLLDFGRELHGALQIGNGAAGRGARARVRFGESASEAMAELGEKGAQNDHAIRDSVIDLPWAGSREIGNAGFRFVRIDAVRGTVDLQFVRAVELMRPMRRLGSFRSSDERLNRIFETAVRTVHLCSQEYLWDGIKRDRLVWIGDLHPEAMAVLNVFGAAPVLRETFDYSIAVTPPDVWMNTMPTYTLWWLRDLAAWFRFTGDADYLARHADYLERTFDHVLAGFGADGRWTAGNFLDWPTEHNAAAATAGTQGLALLAARDVLVLAQALGRDGLADKARTAIARLEKLTALDPAGAKSAAALLALSGLRDPKEMFADVLGPRGHTGVSTFYGYYMIEAMSAAGEHQRALDTVRDYWGAMLDVGATSFWEDFNLAWTNNCFRIDELPVAGKKDVHGDYGEFCYEGFRHSLCHGWSAGPASWCINRVLGIRAADVGCKVVEVRPNLGDLEWAEGAMALPDGNSIFVRVERGRDGRPSLTVRAPDWVKVVRQTPGGRGG